jgi:drug/metabolite transporter (DMT)-like permease
MTVKRPRIDVGWPVQFVALAATWGASFLFIKILDKHWSALWVSFGRVALGAAALLLLVALRGERLPSDRRVWLHCAVAAVLFNAVPWTLFAYGEQHTSSIVAGLWNATTPLWVLVISLAVFDEEHPSAARLAGLVTGFGGVALLLGPWRGFGGGQLIGHVCCGGAALCYGIGFPYTRRHLAGRTESGVVLSAAQLLCATAMLAAFLPLAHEPTAQIGLDGAGSLLALGALGSGVAFAVNYAIVRAAGASTASLVTYLIPAFSTILGVVVLGETLHWNEPVGTVVLLAGVAVFQGRFGRSRPRSNPSPTPKPIPRATSAMARPPTSDWGGRAGG